MFYINNTTVNLTRGDTCYIKVEVDGYTIQNGDEMTLTMATDTDTTTHILQKTIDAFVDTVFEFEHDDTKNLDYGTYKYDVQLDTVDGGVYTIIPPSDFKLLEEVTR